MSTDTKPTLETTNRIVAFRCPPVLASAMEAAPMPTLFRSVTLPAKPS